jgi:hypothetical protein
MCGPTCSSFVGASSMVATRGFRRGEKNHIRERGWREKIAMANFFFARR